MKLHLDFETRSPADLTKIGAWAYASHPQTEIMCIGWAPHAGTAQVSSPRTFVIPIIGAEIISAHNAAFEYAIYNLILHKRYGWPAIWDPKRWSCTMARAAMCGLPLDLDGLSRVLDCTTPKDLEGRKNMLGLSKPLSIDPLDGPVYDETPAKYERLYLYNANDVRTEMEVDAKLPELPPTERAIWELDLVMNRRGVAIDAPFARAAANLSTHLVTGLNGKLRTLTGGAVDSATRVSALKQWLETAHGVMVESLNKVAVTDLLAAPDVPAGAKEVITIRRQVSKTTSVAKYEKALAMMCRDGRVRGSLQYHAAHTGRWGGRLIQPQNMPKGFKAKAQEAAVKAIMDGNPLLFELEHGVDGMDVLSDALRGMIIAGPGKTLVCADFNAIEARVLFWLAGDEAALATYRRGESPYVDMARYIYQNPLVAKETHPQEYDIGKRTILGCGYGMGAERFKENIYVETAKTGKPVTISKALSERAVKAYREKYSNVVRLWYSTEACAINAVRNPGTIFACAGGRVKYQMSPDRRFLLCTLPSGRSIWYFKPSTRMDKTPWGEDKETLCYWGEHPRTHEWCLLKTYGGALVENFTQAIARDLMANGMLNAEAAGYEMLLTVHDELLAEDVALVDGVESPGDLVADFIREMCTVPPWAAGCPVAAEGWTGTRYHK